MNGDQVFEKVVTELFSPLYELAVGAAFIYFLYGVVVFIMGMSDPEKKKNGQSHLLWGTIGLFIIFSVGGIIQLFNDTLGGMFVF